MNKDTIYLNSRDFDVTKLKENFFDWCTDSKQNKDLVNVIDDISNMFKTESEHIDDEIEMTKFSINIWKHLRQKYNLQFDIENTSLNSNEDTNYELIENDTEQQLYCKIRNNILDQFYDYKFEYDKHVGCCGGTNINLKYESYNKTPYNELIDTLKLNIDKFVQISNFKMNHYLDEELVYLIKLKNNDFVYINFSNDDASCAGHYIKVIIHHIVDVFKISENCCEEIIQYLTTKYSSNAIKLN